MKNSNKLFITLVLALFVLVSSSFANQNSKMDGSGVRGGHGRAGGSVGK